MTTRPRGIGIFAHAAFRAKELSKQLDAVFVAQLAGERFARRVAVVARDDQAPSLAHLVQKIPETVAGELFAGFLGDDCRSLLVVFMEMNEIFIRPGVPEKKSRGCGDRSDAIGERVFVPTRRSRRLRPLKMKVDGGWLFDSFERPAEAERRGELVGFCRNFGSADQNAGRGGVSLAHGGH